MVLPIVHYNDSILRTPGKSVTAFDSALKRLADDMIDTMHAAEGIGLAAQQVGLDLQFCVVDLRIANADFDWELDGNRPPLDLFMPLAIANPAISILPSDETVYEEGCLSFPEIRGDVVRPDAISVSFRDVSGVPHVLKCDGLLARCIQHEVDHLQGKLFIDRMEKKVRAKIERDIKALAKATAEAKKA